MPLPTPIRAQGFVIWMLAATSALAQPTTNALFIHRAEQAFGRAQKAYAANPDVATNAWHLGSVSFDLAELTTNMNEKASVAQAGIAACRHLLANDPRSAPGHFYLAMDSGELAEAEAPSMASYKLIRDIEREFMAAAELDERQDHAGPIRSLGLLYRDA